MGGPMGGYVSALTRASNIGEQYASGTMRAAASGASQLLQPITSGIRTGITQSGAPPAASAQTSAAQQPNTLTSAAQQSQQVHPLSSAAASQAQPGRMRGIPSRVRSAAGIGARAIFNRPVWGTALKQASSSAVQAFQEQTRGSPEWTPTYKDLDSGRVVPETSDHRAARNIMGDEYQQSMARSITVDRRRAWVEEGGNIRDLSPTERAIRGEVGSDGFRALMRNDVSATYRQVPYQNITDASGNAVHSGPGISETVIGRDGQPIPGSAVVKQPTQEQYNAIQAAGGVAPFNVAVAGRANYMERGAWIERDGRHSPLSGAQRQIRDAAGTAAFSQIMRTDATASPKVMPYQNITDANGNAVANGPTITEYPVDPDGQRLSGPAHERQPTQQEYNAMQAVGGLAAYNAATAGRANYVGEYNLANDEGDVRLMSENEHRLRQEVGDSGFDATMGRRIESEGSAYSPGMYTPVVRDMVTGEVSVESADAMYARSVMGDDYQNSLEKSVRTDRRDSGAWAVGANGVATNISNRQAQIRNTLGDDAAFQDLMGSRVSLSSETGTYSNGTVDANGNPAVGPQIIQIRIAADGSETTVRRDPNQAEYDSFMNMGPRNFENELREPVRFLGDGKLVQDSQEGTRLMTEAEQSFHQQVGDQRFDAVMNRQVTEVGSQYTGNPQATNQERSAQSTGRFLATVRARGRQLRSEGEY